MSRSTSFVAALGLALGCGGCVSLLPKAAPVQLYRLDPAPPQTAGVAPSVRVGRSDGLPGLVLAQVSLPRPALGDGLLTVRGEEAAYIAGARWLSPAVVLFQEAAERTLRSRLSAVRLIDRSQAGSASVSLRLDVDAFQVRYPVGGGLPVVDIALHATLSRADGRTLLQQDISASQPADADRVSAIVAAYDAGSARVLDQVAAWANVEAPVVAQGLDPSTPTLLPPRHALRGLDTGAAPQ